MARVQTANNALCAALALAAAINVVDGKALSIDYLISYYLTVILFYSESYNLRLEVGQTALQTKGTSSKPDSRSLWCRAFKDDSEISKVVLAVRLTFSRLQHHSCLCSLILLCRTESLRFEFNSPISSLRPSKSSYYISGVGS